MTLPLAIDFMCNQITSRILCIVHFLLYFPPLFSVLFFFFSPIFLFPGLVSGLFYFLCIWNPRKHNKLYNLRSTVTNNIILFEKNYNNKSII